MTWYSYLVRSRTASSSNCSSRIVSHLVQEAERFKAEDEANRSRVEAKSKLVSRSTKARTSSVWLGGMP